MAMCDYYLCDVCGGKCFYDANLNWERNEETGAMTLDYMGAMRAICDSCAITHEVIVQPKAAPPVSAPARAEGMPEIQVGDTIIYEDGYGQRFRYEVGSLDALPRWPIVKIRRDIWRRADRTEPRT